MIQIQNPKQNLLVIGYWCLGFIWNLRFACLPQAGILDFVPTLFLRQP